MLNPNPKLKINVLAEALLEIRFTPAKELPLIVGNMNNQLKEYPIFQDLKIPEFPMQPPEFNNMVRFRFLTDDGKRLYNLGTGVLSINTINYSGFDEFMKDILKILETYQKTSELKNISRIGLRYINKIPLKEKKIEDMFSINIKTPSPLHSIEKGFGFQSNGKIGEDVLTTRLASEELFSTKNMILDFDYYNEQQQEFKIDELKKWIENAHEYVYKSFKESLTKEYFKYLS